MSRTLVAAALALTLFTGRGAFAYGVDDPGTAGCRLLARMYQVGPKGTEYQFFAYVQGYVAAKGGTAAALKAKPTMTRLLAFCAAHPDANFTAAVEDLWADIAAAPAGKS